MKTVYFIRHGESEGNVSKCFQTPNAPLSDVGCQQAKVVAKRCVHIDAELIVSSPMKRAQQTATYIQQATDLPLIIVDYFKEINQASSVWGVSRSSEAGLLYTQKNIEHYVQPDVHFEDAENYTDVQTRIAAGLAFLMQLPEEKFIVTTHNALLKSLIIHVLHGGEATGEIDLSCKKRLDFVRNAGISVLIYDEGEWKLSMYNDHAHFAE